MKDKDKKTDIPPSSEKPYAKPGDAAAESTPATETTTPTEPAAPFVSEPAEANTPPEPKPAAPGASTSGNQPIQNESASQAIPNVLPADLMNDETLPSKPHKPLAGQPINRGYEGGPQAQAASGGGTQIPPGMPPQGPPGSFTPPPSNLPDPDAEDLTKVSPGAQVKQEEVLTPDQKRARAKKAVDKSLMVYGIVRQVGGSFVKIKESYLNDKEQKGELSRFMMMRVAKTGEEVPLQAVVENFNVTVDETVKLPQELIAEIYDDLVEIYMERGIGMSKEASVAISLIKNLIETALDLATMHGSMKNILAFQIEKYKQFHNPGEAQPRGYNGGNAPAPDPESKTPRTPVNPEATDAVLVVEEPAEK